MTRFEKYFYYTTVLFAFTLPLSKAMVSILPSVMFLSWLVHTVIERRFIVDIKKIFSYTVLRYLFIFIGLTIISLLWVQGDDGLFNYRFNMVYLFVLIIPAMVVYIKPQQTVSILSAFLLGMLISEIVSYGIFFEWWHYKDVKPSDPSPFMKHIEYSTLLAFTSLFLLYRLVQTHITKERILYGLFFLTVTGNLFINGGRTGQVIFFTASLIVLFVSMKNRLKAFVIFVLLASSVASSAYFLSDTFKERTVLFVQEAHSAFTQSDFSGSVGIRIGSILPAWELFKQKPILGYGWMGHSHDMRMIIEEKYPAIRSGNFLHLDFQNQFYMVAVQFGIVGLVLFIAIFVALFRMKHSKEDTILKTIFLSVLMLYFFSEGWVHHFVLAWGAMMIAILSIRAVPKPHTPHQVPSTN